MKIAHGLLASLPFLFAANINYAVEYIAPDVSERNMFGYGVAISGDTTLISMPGLDSRTGVLYLFDKDTGVVLSEIVAEDLSLGDFFGASPRISENYAVVGAQSGGSAYVFDISTGAQLHKFSVEGLTVADQFGFSADIYENYVFVGAPGQNKTGAVYVYDTVTGASVRTLEASDPGDGSLFGDRFGDSISLYGNYAVVAASGKNTSKGAVYIFDVSTGAELHKLEIAGVDNYYGFGSSTDLHGKTAIIGAYGDKEKGMHTGAAYIYDVETGAQLHKLTASDAEAGSMFGHSVAISDKHALIGAMTADSLAGAAYIFDVESGNELIKLSISNGNQRDSFGTAVAIDGDRFIVSAHLKDSNPPDVDDDIGAAYGGYISSMTTLDDGSSKAISALSFKSHTDWIIGENVSGNSVSLGGGDKADITATGKAVYVGKNNSSNNNSLIISGTLDAGEVYVGNAANSGNIFKVESGGVANVDKLHLSLDNTIEIAGELAVKDTLYIAIASGTEFTVVDVSAGGSIIFDENMGLSIALDYTPTEGTVFEIISSGLSNNSSALQDGAIVSANGVNFMVISQNDSFSLVVVPEPAVFAAVLGALAFAFAARRRMR